MRSLTVAVAKGRLGEKAASLFEAIGCDASTLWDALGGRSRSLVVAEPNFQLRFILAKAMDVPTFVEYGAADLGIVGKDVLLEADRHIIELADLGYAQCSFVLAVPVDSGIRSVNQLDYNCRVASKYPHVTSRFLSAHGIQADVIPLNGSVELGPLVGLADAIVDITETGRTLKENGLDVIATVAESSARLVANRISYKVDYERIGHIVRALKEQVAEGVLK